ncbi:MAG TPA: NlpC/P60 family protein [Acidimicrobiales bacterium]|nr:NlpC/P60 family protein [Acidimicrobiales bacterium]
MAVVATVGWVALPVARAGADPVSSSQANLNQINGQLQGAQAEAAQVEGQLQSDGTRLDELAQQYETAQQQVASLDAQLTAVEAQVAQTQARVSATEAVLRHEALVSYMSGATDASFASIFTAPDAQASVTREYEDLAGANLSNTVDTLNAEERALAVQQAQVASTEAQARAGEAQVAASEQQAQQVAAQQQSELSQVKGQVATLLAQQQQAQQALAAAQYQQQVAEEQAQEQAQQALEANTVSAEVAVSPGAAGAVQAAESQLGVPYVWGGESPKGSPAPGFDCSGLTQWSWAQAGVQLPRTAQEQYDAIAHVDMSDLQPGDLVFWDDGTSSVQHVGMYVGDGDVIDAPETGEVVQIQPIWTNGLVGAGRP